MNQFLWGALATLSLTAALYFWKYWRRTHEALFAGFAAGFLALSLHWAGLGLLNPTRETGHYLYIVRLAAFTLIIAAIVQKNRSSSRAKRPGG
jgi:hypothetical protein